MAKASTQPPKGTRDFLPQDVRRRNYVTGVIREVFLSHGFSPLETPAMERLDALMGKYGEEGDQLLFKVLLRGQPLVKGIRNATEELARPGGIVDGRSGQTAPKAEPMLADLGLRYDLTVPFARVVAAYQGKLPKVFKRYQIQPVWRADTPGKGRFREFYQCDVDIVGSESRLVEAEVAAAAASCLQKLGFKHFTIRLNHRGLLRALVDIAGVDTALETEAITAIDKLDKIGTDGVVAELARRGVPGEAANKLVKIISGDTSLSGIRDHCEGHEGAQAALSDLDEVLDLSTVTSAHAHLKFDVSLARGLSYYTGCIFEIAVAELAGSLGGGGRYDGLIGMFSGRQVPACGLSLGLERILVVMEARDMFPSALEQPDVVVACVSAQQARQALKLSHQLRDAGIRVDLQPNPVKPGKLKKLAYELGIGAALWLEPGANISAGLWLKDAPSLNDLNLEQAKTAVLSALGS